MVYSMDGARCGVLLCRKDGSGTPRNLSKFTFTGFLENGSRHSEVPKRFISATLLVIY